VTSNPDQQSQSAALPIPITTNYVALTRKDHNIKERYAIDPFISVPPSLLPPLEEGETEADRKNLKIKTKDGSVDVDLWVLGGGGDIKEEKLRRKRATLDLSSNDGSITIRMVSMLQMNTNHPVYPLTCVPKALCCRNSRTAPIPP
jgi:hypothetical protein